MKIFAVLVSYKPDLKLLTDVVASLIHQVDSVIVVDNGNTEFSSAFDNCIVIHLNANFGIAYAQNRGIEKALSLDADWILLSDQDTVYPSDYVSSMLECARKNTLQNIGGLVPVVFDEISGRRVPVMLEKMKGAVPPVSGCLKVAHAVASGTLIPADALQKCGLMREDFFIDFVDHEWCWRAASCGLNIYCLADVVIHHQLGDRMEKRFGLNIVYRSLFRFYYIIRNGYYLLRHTDYLKGQDRFLFWLLMQKKKAEVLLLNRFDSASRAVVRSAVRNGKAGQFISYEETFS